MLATDTKSSTRPRPGARRARAWRIATVVETWGSAPRPVGSQLVDRRRRQFPRLGVGRLRRGRGGHRGARRDRDGKPRMLDFGVADETAWQVGLACGGTIQVYVERRRLMMAR